MNKKFYFDFPAKNLPIVGLRDLLNVVKQSLKYKFIPYRLYYKYRAYKYAKHTTPELNVISLLTDKTKISLDIGANLGLFTYFMSKCSDKVYAFEPNPYPLEYLKHVVDSNVEVVPIAMMSFSRVIL